MKVRLGPFGLPASLRRFCQAVSTLESLLLAPVFFAALFLTPVRSLALLTIPLLWGARRVGFGYFLPQTPFAWPILGLLAATLVSLFATFDRQTSVPMVAHVLVGVAILYAVLSFASKSTRHLMWAALAFLLVGTVVATVGLMGTRWPAKIPLLRDGLMTHFPLLLTFPGDPDGFSPNRIAAALLWVTPLAWVLTAAALLNRAGPLRDWPRSAVIFLLGFISLFLGSVLFLTQSRAGLVAFVLTILCLLLFALRRRRWLIVGTVIISLVFSLVTVQLDDPFGIQTWLKAAGNTSAGSSTPIESIESRIEIWQRAVQGIRTFAFTGMGMGTFPQVAPVFFPYFTFALADDTVHAHNQVLQMGVDLGIPGIIAYLALLIVSATMLFRVWRKGTSVWLKRLSLGLASSLLAFEFWGLFDAVGIGEKPSVLFWYLLGLVAGLYRLATCEIESQRQNRAQAREPMLTELSG